MRSIETWDDLVAAGETIKARTGHTLLSSDVATGGTFQMLLQQQGLGLFDEAGEIAITAPEAVEALTLLQTMNEKGLLKNVKGWDGRVTECQGRRLGRHARSRVVDRHAAGRRA